MSHTVKDLLISDVPLAIFDLETTGFSPDKGAEIVEISVVRLIPGQPPEIILDSLIRPRGPVRATSVHKITSQDVQDAPQFKAFAPQILQALSDSIWVAYNVSFDVPFLLKMLKKELNFDCSPPYLCAKNIRSLLGLKKAKKLAETCQEFGVDFRQGMHQAIYDTWYTALLMQVWLDRMEYLGIKTYGDLQQKGTHKYLPSLNEPLWSFTSPISTPLPSKSRYALDLGRDPFSSDPLPPIGSSSDSSSSTSTLHPSTPVSQKKESLKSTPSSSHSRSPQNGSASKPSISKPPTSKPPTSKPQSKSSPTLGTSKKTQSKFTLRPYQNEAIQSILNARHNKIKRMVVSLPTGAGKTVIFSHLASLARHRVLVLAHREELLTQAQSKLQNTLSQEILVDIEQAQNQASPDAKVVVASLRSLKQERLARLIESERFQLIIYDECHHAVADDNQRILRELGVFDPDFKGTLVGFTATSQRADGRGLEEVFEEIVYSRNLTQMIEDQYLVPLKGYRISTHQSLEGIGGQGDFPLEALEEKVNIEDRNGLVARSIQELARDRRTICFCVTIAHATALAQTLRQIGVPAEVIHGELKGKERNRILEDFKQGELQVITNVGVLTEGFDDPEVSCVAMARPTRSEGLYIQCVGRGMRLAEGKKDCLVLDFVDLSALRLVTLPTLFGLPQEMDFAGEDALEQAQGYERLQEEFPGFEWDAETISLQELKERALVFDPLRLKLSPEIAAISANGWVSLGQRGVVLHFARSAGQFSEVAVLLTHESGKSKYIVLLDEKEMTRFSRLEEAVESTDFEIARMGSWAIETAHATSSWRLSPVSAELLESLPKKQLPQPPKNLEELFRALSYFKYVVPLGKKKKSSLFGGR